MESGYKKIIWGLLIATFHITLFAIPIFPAFVGWLLIVSGVKSILEEEENPSYQKAYHYAFITTMITIVTQLFTWVSYENDFTQYLTIVYSIFNLLFIFYIFKGSIEYLAAHGKQSDAEHFIGVQKVYIIIYILNTILACGAITIVSNSMIMLAAIIGIIMVIGLTIALRNIINIEIDPPEDTRENGIDVMI